MLQTPQPTTLPTVPQVTVDGAQLSSPQAVYQAFKAQRRELGRQMDALEGTRENLSTQLQEPTITGADRKGLESRITDVDSRISSLQKQISDADAQVAKAAGIPGAAVDPPEPPRNGPPDAVWVLSGMLIWVVLLPMSIAFARRIWRKSGRVNVATLPKELSDRLAQVEQTVESTAIEVERIGEGQRFITKVFTEHTAPALALGAQTVPARVEPPGEVRR